MISKLLPSANATTLILSTTDQQYDTHNVIHIRETESTHPTNIDSKHVYPETVFDVCFLRDNFKWARTSSFTRFLDHTQRLTTVGRTPLDD
jgi:hypothetical protein